MDFCIPYKDEDWSRFCDSGCKKPDQELRSAGKDLAGALEKVGGKKGEKGGKGHGSVCLIRMSKVSGAVLPKTASESSICKPVSSDMQTAARTGHLKACEFHLWTDYCVPDKAKEWSSACLPDCKRPAIFDNASTNLLAPVAATRKKGESVCMIKRSMLNSASDHSAKTKSTDLVDSPVCTPASPAMEIAAKSGALITCDKVPPRSFSQRRSPWSSLFFVLLAPLLSACSWQF